MQDETAIEDVALGDQLKTVDNVVVLRVRVRREEVLDDFQGKEDFGILQELPKSLVFFEAEGHHVETYEHIRHHHDADDDLEHSHEQTVRIQDVPIRPKLS